MGCLAVAADGDAVDVAADGLLVAFPSASALSEPPLHPPAANASAPVTAVTSIAFARIRTVLPARHTSMPCGTDRHQSLQMPANPPKTGDVRAYGRRTRRCQRWPGD